MNTLLMKKVQPYVDELTGLAVGFLDVYIKRVDDSISNLDEVPEGQPLLNPDVRKRIRKLIEGEKVDSPTELELNVAGVQLDKAIEEMTKQEIFPCRK